MRLGVNEAEIGKLFKNVLNEYRGDFDKAVFKVLRELGYADFDEYKVEYVIEGRLVAKTPVHIGSGVPEPYSPVDNSVVKLYGVEPYIPGSSLKGVLRSFVESLAISLGLMLPEVRLEVVIGWGERRQETIGCTGERLSDAYKVLKERPVIDSLLSMQDEFLGKLVCRCLCSPVVGLFGSPWLASHVKILDAYPEGRASTMVLQKVAIDRFTGSQRPGLLYSIEAVEPGASWRLRIRIFNIDLEDDSDSRVKLLKMALNTLMDGIFVGARSSIGLGLVKLDEETAVYRVLRVEPDKGLVVSKPKPLKELLKG